MSPSPKPVTLSEDTRVALTARVLLTLAGTTLAAILAGALWAWGIGRDVEDLKSLAQSMNANLGRIADSRLSDDEFAAWLKLFAARNQDLDVPDPIVINSDR